MQLQSLVAALPAKKKAIYTLESGKPVCRSYPTLFADVVLARDALLRWGVAPRMRVGIYAPNSYQWLVYDLALLEVGAISMAFTDDFAGQINQDLLDRYNIALLLLSKSGAKLFADKPAHIAFIDADNGAVQAMDRPLSGDADEADQHALAFSSGSAGGLKGLVISRTGIEETLPPIAEAMGLTANDRLLLFLPMSNFQQRNLCYATLWNDFDLIITDHIQVFDAMKALNPTFVIAPPVLYQMVHAEFLKFPAAKQARWHALGRALSLLPGRSLRQALGRRLFGEIYGQFGNAIRVLITGMAPGKRNVGEFFALIQLPLCESYGLMETGSLTFRGPDCTELGSVGKLVRGVRVSVQSDGELIVHREHSLTLRYFQCAEGENERTFIAPGAVATGDIGAFDADGNLHLNGRKKALLIMPGGLKLHPEQIEEQLNNFPDVAHSIFFLKDGAASLTCVVSLIDPASLEARARVKAFISKMADVRKASPFVEILFADQAFSRENGMLRPNLKIDRKGIAARYS